MKKAAFYTGISALFLLPDTLFLAFHRHLPLCFFHEKALLLVLLVILVSFIKNKYAVGAFFFVFGLMHTVQLCCLAYFGTALNSFTISLLFEELSDVFSESVNMSGYFWYIPVLIALPYYACTKIITSCKTRFSFPYAWGTVLCFFAFFAVESHIKHDLLMRSSCYAGINTVTAYTAYFGNILPKQLLQKEEDYTTHFKPYVVTKTNATPDINVIVIIGESLNRNHFSLYGYERDTTPLLKKRAQEDKSFVYKDALSGAVNTLIAVPNFLHVQREPQNYQKQLKSDTYLTKLAKENGFSTVYIGLQGKAVYAKEALSFFDKAYIYSLNKEKCSENECIEQSFDDFDFSSPVFAVIQKRNPHAPYEEYYPASYARFGNEKDEVNVKRINTYDNALLYEDFLVDSIFNDLQKRANRPTYVYYVSDHGEAMGEDGKYGHSFLHPAVSEIPFIFTVLNGSDETYTQKIRDAFYPTAYEIGILIAEKLGYSIENPNEDGKTFYMNGHHKMGKAGYLLIEKDKSAQTLKRTVIQGSVKK